MAAKIFNVGVKNIRISDPVPLPVGPGFYFISSLDLSQRYPAIADAASGDVQKVAFNMGQNQFQGDPLGFQAYDTNYNVNNWSGLYTIESGNIIVPENLETVIYNKTYNSGKYYFEATIVDAGYASALGMTTNSGHHSALTDERWGVGVEYIGTFDPTVKSISSVDTWSSAYNIIDNDILQIWVDFDNDLLCVKKLGTDINDHQNYTIA